MCSGGLDAVCGIKRTDKQIFFKDTYFWNYGDENAKQIRSAWPELPANLTHVDAVFNPFVDQLWFFVGTEIYIFDGEQFQQKSSLHEIGIDETKYSKIDAVFQYLDENHTFIFSGEDYWRLNVSWINSKVYDGYPQKIESVWKNAASIDTVSYNTYRLYQLFFLKGPLLSTFDHECMQVDWSPSGNTWSVGETFIKGCLNDTRFHSVSETFTTSECKKPVYEAASDDARWIIKFFKEFNE